jgi:predicted cation transporter
MLTLALATLVIVLVLLGPVFIGPVERNVELFFLLVGVLTACIMGQFNAGLV